MDAARESEQSLAAIDKRLERLRVDPVVTARVHAIVKEHAATIKTAQRRLPMIEKTHATAAEQHARDARTLATAREMESLEHGVVKAQERERVRSRGMGMGR